jgi:serine/threonine-protein kinase
VPPLPASVPADLAAVVTRSLSKEPGERFADGTAFAAALRNPSGVAAAAPAATTQVMSGAAPVPPVPPTATTATEKRRVPWLWVLLAVILLVGIIALIAIAATNGDEDEDPTADDPSGTRSSQTQQESPSESATTETPPEETPTETEPETFSIDPDDYVGRDIKDVEDELRALGLKPAKEKLDNDGTQEENAVESVSPTDDLQEGDSVTVQYWGKPAPVVPTETATETATGTETGATTGTEEGTE